MNLPKLPAQPNSVDECIRIYLERLLQGNAPWPHVSALLTAYLSWPNDQDRRNSLIATCLARLGATSENRAQKHAAESPTGAALEMFGGVNAIASAAFDQLSGEIGQIQRRWLWAADIFQLILDMTYEKRAVLRGGASISKAIDLCEYEQGLPGHSQLRAAWSEFRDVAHLLTASAYLAHEGLIRGNAEGSILETIWIAPDAVLTLAYGLQEFGLERKPIQKQPSTLDPEGLWRLSDGHEPTRPFIVHRRLSDTQLHFLSTRRASKKYIPSSAAALR